MKRFLDILLATAALVVLAAPATIVALAVKFTSPGPAIYWCRRIGRGNRIFWMPKFRTMRVDTPQVATHLLTDARRWLTPIGAFLRKTSLDEVPQLWSVLIGDMSLVGPRPALFNQQDLMAMRTAAGVDQLTPGITGWAQINGRDELTLEEKVAFDRYYLEHQGLRLDLKILALTALKVVTREGIAQAGEERRDRRYESPSRRAA